MPDFNEDAQLDTGQVQDLRGSGGGGRLPLPGGIAVGGGLTGLILAVVVGLLGLSGNLGSDGEGAPEDGTTLSEQCDESNSDRFARADCRGVLFINSIQAYWEAALPEHFDAAYQPADTRYFSGVVDTGCGGADSGVGPFYCPADQHVYVDLTFFEELAARFGAPGEFAEAYVLAHEYGHHVQNLLGIEAEMRRAQQRDPGSANEYSIMLELQADCLAGAWAGNATGTTDVAGTRLFEEVTAADVAEAVDAAAAVGDDAIQEQAGVEVDQDTWTHGSSRQRQEWFTRGYRTGDPTGCDTFAA